MQQCMIDLKNKGIPRTCKLSYEEKRHRLRINYKLYREANLDKERERIKLACARLRAEAKNKYNLENQLFFGFLKNEFPFKQLTSL